jgi:hypothetical protein
MKSFFSFNQALHNYSKYTTNSIVDASLDKLSVIELYDVLLEIIDSVKTVRKISGDQLLEPADNSEVRSDPENWIYGGLRIVRPRPTIVPFTQSEKRMLEKIQAKIVKHKKYLKEQFGRDRSLTKNDERILEQGQSTRNRFYRKTERPIRRRNNSTKNQYAAWRRILWKTYKVKE